MKTAPSPLLLVLASVAGWLNREQHRVLEYLREENRILRDQVGSGRL